MSEFIANLRQMASNDRSDVLERLITDSLNLLFELEAVVSTIAMTNATQFEIDDNRIDLDAAEFVDDEVRVPLWFHADGEHEEVQYFFGNQIAGRAIARIDDDGMVTYEIVDVDLVDPTFL